MNESDVGKAGLSALAGATTALGPAAAPIAFVLLALDQLLALDGGEAGAPPPSLDGAQVARIIRTETLFQDVRDAWSSISVAFDFHADWVRRAKSGEVFTDADRATFYGQLPSKITETKTGIRKLYSGEANIDRTPGQYGLPYLITGVGVLVHLLECSLQEVRSRGEEISLGEWQTFLIELQSCAKAIEDCERLARARADEAIRTIRSEHPALKPGDAELAKKVASVEIIYLGGVTETQGSMGMPAGVALRDLFTIIGRVNDQSGRMQTPAPTG